MSLARITFELTSRCNLNCKHCMRDRSLKNDLEPKLIARVLKELKPYGISKVAFTGGEPLLHPHFQKIVESVVRQGFVFSFVSNGIELPRFADFLARPAVKEKIERICISIDGADAEIHDRVRGRGTWKKAMAGVLALKSRGIPFAVKFTLNTQNHTQLEEMILLAGKLGADQVQLSHLHPVPQNMAAGLVMAPGEWKSLQEQVERLKDIVKVPLYFSSENLTDEAIPICTQLAMLDYYVDSRGWLCVCCMLPGIAGSKSGQPEKDRVADLATTSFVEAHKRLIELIREMRLRTLERIAQGRLSELEHYQCLQCAFQMGKLDWLENFPHSPWAVLFKQAKGDEPC